MNWLKHAFALDDGTPAEPTADQQQAIDRILREILRRRLDVPAGMLLEACRPLNYVGAQALRFFSPMMQAVLGLQGQNDFAEFLEKRKSVDYLLSRLETLRTDSVEKSDSSAPQADSLCEHHPSEM
ncbi:MAG TPA: hypothetical protein VMM56_14610 [Planctomycetaceae bacterium]|nr:hypothetical protein [Planctomycetaceae bacterium]